MKDQVWLPLESAPKDMTNVLVCLARPFEGRRVWIAHQNMYGDWTAELDGDRVEFYLVSAEERGIEMWMPLPEPPPPAEERG